MSRVAASIHSLGPAQESRQVWAWVTWLKLFPPVRQLSEGSCTDRYLFLLYHSIHRFLSRPIGCIARRTTLACLLVLGLDLLGIPASLLGANPPLKRYEYSLPRMGTIFRVEIYSLDSTTAAQAAEAAFARAEELEQIMSDYRADSELMRLEREGSAAPFPVSSDLYRCWRSPSGPRSFPAGFSTLASDPLVKLWRDARRSGASRTLGNREGKGASGLPQHRT